MVFIFNYFEIFLFKADELIIAQGVWILNLQILTEPSSDRAKNTTHFSCKPPHKSGGGQNVPKPNPGTNSEQKQDTEPSSPNKLKLAS